MASLREPETNMPEAMPIRFTRIVIWIPAGELDRSSAIAGIAAM
jgi:hypothetical protein